MNSYSVVVVLSILFLIYTSWKLVHHIVDHEFFWKLSFFTTISSIIGAKIFHVMEGQNFLYYSSNPQEILSPFGYSILGAITFGYITIFVLSVIYKAKFLHLTDRIFLVLPLSQTFGRIGNITNNELLPFSFYEMIFNILNFLVLLFVFNSKKRPDGIVTSLFFLIYGTSRLYIEFLKENLGFLALVSVVFILFGLVKTIKISNKL